uniref:Uncharacterized protein n=1 Tax=Salix viminalis TaxID=40686 RepID=A0A6N2MNG5_SALVM
MLSPSEQSVDYSISRACMISLSLEKSDLMSCRVGYADLCLAVAGYSFWAPFIFVINVWDKGPHDKDREENLHQQYSSAVWFALNLNSRPHPSEQARHRGGSPKLEDGYHPPKVAFRELFMNLTVHLWSRDEGYLTPVQDTPYLPSCCSVL